MPTRPALNAQWPGAGQSGGAGGGQGQPNYSAEVIGYRTFTRTAGLGIDEPESPVPHGTKFEEVPVHEPDLTKKPIKSALKGNRAKAAAARMKRQSSATPRTATIQEEIR